MNHQESEQVTCSQLALQQQLLDLLRRKSTVHDQMMALLRAPRQPHIVNGMPVTWSGLRTEYARLEDEINGIRRQIN
jgi:hypothetical protein